MKNIPQNSLFDNLSLFDWADAQHQKHVLASPISIIQRRFRVSPAHAKIIAKEYYGRVA